MSLERYSYYKRNHAAADRRAAVVLLDPQPGPKKIPWPDPDPGIAIT